MCDLGIRGNRLLWVIKQCRDLVYYHINTHLKHQDFRNGDVCTFAVCIIGEIQGTCTL